MKFLAFSLLDVVFITLINVIFMSRIYFLLSRVKHGNFFITFGQDVV